MEIQTPAPILMKFVQGRFWCRFALRPLTLGLGGIETLKAEGHIFKMLSRFAN